LKSDFRSLPADIQLPLVTVLVPCRNEVRFIESCLTSIVGNGYPESLLQVVVIDGQSDDGTVGIVQRYEGSHPCVSLIENPRRITPSALNLGVRAGVRRKDDLRQRRTRDPIRRLNEALMECGEADVNLVELLDFEVRAEVAAALTLAESDPFPRSETLLSRVYGTKSS
jgi:glycosyltransferase involved in cell wall biosynthesis